MKNLFVILGVIILLLTGCGSSSELESNDTKILNESIEEKVIESNIEESITEPEIKDEIVEETKDPEIKKEEPIVKTETTKQAEVKKEIVAQKPETVLSNDNTPKKEESKELTFWEELGMTKEEFDNTPMGSWRTVTHKTKSECDIAGDQMVDDDTNNYTSYWCHEVISYSGKTLGYMLSPDE